MKTKLNINPHKASLFCAFLLMFLYSGNALCAQWIQINVSPIPQVGGDGNSGGASVDIPSITMENIGNGWDRWSTRYHAEAYGWSNVERITDGNPLEIPWNWHESDADGGAVIWPINLDLQVTGLAQDEAVEVFVYATVGWNSIIYVDGKLNQYAGTQVNLDLSANGPDTNNPDPMLSWYMPFTSDMTDGFNKEFNYTHIQTSEPFNDTLTEGEVLSLSGIYQVGASAVVGPYSEETSYCNISSDLDLIILTQTVSTVPIPPAVWLLGTGLLCLLGIRRKVKKA